MQFGPGQFDRLIAALDRHADALNRLADGLGCSPHPRYTPPAHGGMTDEKQMAEILKISHRTLGKHRREGRLPGCWIRNGGRVVWRVEETVAAWRKGIA